MVPVFVFGVFLSVATVLFLLPLLLLGVAQALAGTPFGVSVQLVLGHLRFFRSVSCSWLPFWSSTPGWLRLAALLLQWRFRVELGLSWYRCPVTPLCFFLVLAQLPLRGSAPFTGELACLTPVCRSPPGVWLVGTYCVLFLRACGVRCFPCCWFLGVFRSPGVCTSASLATWVGLQPFPSFSGLLLLRFLAGVVGVLHPVSGCSSWDVFLVCRCGHPAAFPLP